MIHDKTQEELEEEQEIAKEFISKMREKKNEIDSIKKQNRDRDEEKEEEAKNL